LLTSVAVVVCFSLVKALWNVAVGIFLYVVFSLVFLKHRTEIFCHLCFRFLIYKYSANILPRHWHYINIVIISSISIKFRFSICVKFNSKFGIQDAFSVILGVAFFRIRNFLQSS